MVVMIPDNGPVERLMPSNSMSQHGKPRKFKSREAAEKALTRWAANYRNPTRQVVVRRVKS